MGFVLAKIMIKKGDRFNRLTAVKFIRRDKKSNQYWLFKCDCGGEKIIFLTSVKFGRTKSCGCLIIEKKTIHGMRYANIYTIWASMCKRCNNKNNKDYKNYGGRGIKICESWEKFENFYADMGERPKDRSLDRINNDGNYCKENCRWATRKEQVNNKRTNHLLTYKGKTQNITQWSKELGINKSTIRQRILRGWGIGKTLNFGNLLKSQGFKIIKE